MRATQPCLLLATQFGLQAGVAQVHAVGRQRRNRTRAAAGRVQPVHATMGGFNAGTSIAFNCDHHTGWKVLSMKKSVVSKKLPRKTQSASNVGAQAYVGQPGLGSYEQGFQLTAQGNRAHPGQDDPGQTWDPEYAQWRADQLRMLDEDYRAFRSASADRSAPAFEAWRSQRQAGVAPIRSDGLTALTSSTSAGEGTVVAAGRRAKDPGSVP